MASCFFPHSCRLETRGRQTLAGKERPTLFRRCLPFDFQRAAEQRPMRLESARESSYRTGYNAPVRWHATVNQHALKNVTHTSISRGVLS